MPSLKVISSQVMTNVDILKEKFRATRPISKDSTPNSLDSIMILKNQKKKGRNFMQILIKKIAAVQLLKNSYPSMHLNAKNFRIKFHSSKKITERKKNNILTYRRNSQS